MGPAFRLMLLPGDTAFAASWQLSDVFAGSGICISARIPAIAAGEQQGIAAAETASPPNKRAKIITNWSSLSKIFQ